MKPAWVGAVTVTFSTTADTPAGTPPRPVTCNDTVPNGATAAWTAPTPVRVSNSRDGDREPYAPDLVGVAADAELGNTTEASTPARPNAHTVMTTIKRF